MIFFAKLKQSKKWTVPMKKAEDCNTVDETYACQKELEGDPNRAYSHFPGHAAGTGLCVFAICFRQFQRPAL
ncbi:hypothetical protein [Desulfobacter sp.]|uniref:hypothetical protein n=1 Tax=Desulfobacter sp. TaxID=2294 RepID=UPI003D0C9956